MKFNTTIAAPSPLIALGSLAFNGTYIWLNGVSDGTTGYTVRLDGGSLSFRGRLPTNCIFAAGPINPSEPEHHISYTPVSIVDSVVIQTDVPEGSKVWDDSMIFWHFETKTEGFWSIKQCLHPGRRAGSCRVSEGSGTAITYTFDGPLITIWGAVENSNSLYTVSIDGSEPKLYTPPSNASPAKIVALAHASKLGPGQHTVTVTSLPKDGRSRIEIVSAESFKKWKPLALPVSEDGTFTLDFSSGSQIVS